jgi:hypothetical protein
MRMVGRLGWTLPAAVTALALAACSSNTASPTGATAAAATAAAEQLPAASMIVQGTVVDAAGRPMAAQVECMGDVQCVAFGSQVIQQDGPDDGVKTNAAGGYVMVVRRTGTSDRFLMNATAKSYEMMIRDVAFADPSCTADRSDCVVNVNFTLAPQAD